MADELCDKCKKRPADKALKVFVGKRRIKSGASPRYKEVSEREFRTCRFCRTSERVGIFLGPLLFVLIPAGVLMLLGGSPQDLREGAKDGFPPAALLAPVLAYLWERAHIYLPLFIVLALVGSVVENPVALADPARSIAKTLLRKEGLSLLAPADVEEFVEAQKRDAMEQ